MSPFYLLKSVNNVIKIILIFQNSQFFYSYIFTIHPEYQGCRNNIMQTKEEEKTIYVGIFTAVPKLKKKLKSVIKQFLYPISKNKVQKGDAQFTPAVPHEIKTTTTALYFTASSRDRTEHPDVTSNELCKEQHSRTKRASHLTESFKVHSNYKPLLAWINSSIVNIT